MFGAVCSMMLLAILALELLVAPYGSLGALAVVPVAAAAWLLPGRGTTFIVVLALIVRVFGVSVGGVDVLTAGVEAIVLIIVAVTIRLAGSLLVRWQDSEARLRLQAESFAVLAERERIASQVYESTIHALIGATLQLQSAGTMIDQAPPRGRIQATIADLDKLIVELRQTILKPEPGISPAASRVSDSRTEALGDRTA
jgi:signal transduction histidine kinase